MLLLIVWIFDKDLKRFLFIKIDQQTSLRLMVSDYNLQHQKLWKHVANLTPIPLSEALVTLHTIGTQHCLIALLFSIGISFGLGIFPVGPLQTFSRIFPTAYLSKQRNRHFFSNLYCFFSSVFGEHLNGARYRRPIL